MHRWRLARVMDDQPFEMPRQPRAATQVIGDHRGQAQAQAPAMVIGEQAVAFDYHDVQAIVGVVQHPRIAAGQQVVEHAPAALADVGHGHAFGKALLVVQPAEVQQALYRVGQAGTGKAPGADGRTDQRPFPWRARQPVAEQRQVQTLDTQRLGATGRTGQNADVGRRKALFADAREGAFAGLEGQGGKLDVDGCHTGLD